MILKEGSGKKSHPKLHPLIMKTDDMIMSIWHTAVVFKPRASTLGLMMVTGKFANDTIDLNIVKDDADMPPGKRLV